MKKSTIFLIIVFTCSLNLKAQKTAGIAGKKNLIGYQGNVLLGNAIIFGGPSLTSGSVFYERLIDYRSNIGISYSRSHASRDIESSNDFSGTIRYQFGDTNYYVLQRSIEGKYRYKVNSFEINTRRFRKKNSMRNFGIFYNYKIGLNLINCTVPKSTEFDVGMTYYNYLKTIKSKEDQSITLTQNYVGFELGNALPLFQKKLIFTFSASFMINFVKNYVGEISFKDYSKGELGNEISLNQTFNLHFGLAHAF